MKPSSPPYSSGVDNRSSAVDADVAGAADDESGSASVQRRHHHHRSRRSRHFWWQKLARRFDRLLEHVEQAPFYGLLILLVMLPLVYQGGDYWWLPLANGLLVLLYAVWGLTAWWRGGDAVRWRWHAGMLLFVFPLALGLVQSMPLPDGVVARLSPVGWSWWENLNRLGLGAAPARLSLAPDYTLRTCELLLLCLLTFTLLLHKARHRSGLRLVAAAVALSAFANAGFAFWEFWRQDQGGGMLEMTVFTGAFMNRNHFGFMMMLGVLAAMGLLTAIGAASRKQADDSPPAWQLLIIPTTFMLFGMQTAQVLSLSRGAFMATVAAAMCFGLVWLVRGARVAAGRQKILALAIVLGAALLLALPPALSRLSERYQHLLDSESLDGEDRLIMWRETLALIKSYPWSGTGLGAYGDAIQPYEKGVFPDGLIEHAHNDWLEMTAEVGVPMAMVIIILAGWLLARAGRRIWQQKDMTMRWVGLGALAAILGGLIHEIVDFNLLAMPNALLFSALLALVFLCGRSRPSPEDSPESARLAAGGETAAAPGRGAGPNGVSKQVLSAVAGEPGRWQPRRLVFLLAGLAAVALIPWHVRRVGAAWQHTKLYYEIESEGPGWQPGWKDYQRRVGMADAALAGYPGHAAILRQRAISLVPLAYLLPGESLEHMAAARADSAAACRRLPADGDTLRICANIHEQSGLLDGRVDELQVTQIYERALASQPRIRNMMREVGDAYRRSYHRLARPAGSPASPLAEQQRRRALELLLDYLHSGGGYSQNMLAMVMGLTESPEQLLEIMPRDAQMNRVLFDFLVSSQNYDQAFELQAKERQGLPADRNSDLEAADEWRDWYGRQIQLLGLTGQWAQRSELMPEYLRLAAVSAEKRLRRCDDLCAAGKINEAATYLLGLRREVPVSYPTLLREAAVTMTLGKAEEVPNVLLPFAYGVLDPPTPAELKQALDLLAQIGEQGFSTFNIRERFLRLVLPLLAAEARQASGLAMARDWADGLERLEKTLADGEHGPWLQQHLLSFFAGRAYELAGDQALATAAYQRSLALCPGNIYVLLRLEKLAGSLVLSENDREVLALYHELQRTAPVMARFTPALTWCGLRVTPAEVRHFHESIEVDYVWLCTGDVQFDCAMEVEMANAAGRLFTDSVTLTHGDRSTVSWRVGEMVVKRRQYNPMLLMAKSGNKIENSQVTASVRMQSRHTAARRDFVPMPKAVAPASRVVVQ